MLLVKLNSDIFPHHWVDMVAAQTWPVDGVGVRGRAGTGTHKTTIIGVCMLHLMCNVHALSVKLLRSVWCQSWIIPVLYSALAKLWLCEWLLCLVWLCLTAMCVRRCVHGCAHIFVKMFVYRHMNARVFMWIILLTLRLAKAETPSCIKTLLVCVISNRPAHIWYHRIADRFFKKVYIYSWADSWQLATLGALLCIPWRIYASFHKGLQK